MKQATLCFLVKDNQILLAMKKRGFGVGKWNGVGGKVNEEMKPQWFDIDKIPYDKMWVDDIYWLPKALDGQKLRGRFVFDKDQKMIEHELII
ncbi:MAG: hypothetical protein AAB550_01680 [Patescibacteria group bacterium]